MSESLAAYAIKLADEFDKAERVGARNDSPEGIRIVQISDTLLREISRNLREKAKHGEKEDSAN